MLALPKQIRQTCDIDGYSTKFVLGQHLRLQSFSRVVPRVQISQRLVVGVADDVPTGNGFGAPGGEKRR